MGYSKGYRTARRGLTRRELLRAGVGAGAALWTLSALGCGQTETKQAAKTAPQEKQPKRGGSISIVATFDPQGMDPHTSSAASMLIIADMFYSSPLRFKPSLTSYEIEPDLVEKWEQPDELNYILHVRKGVKWHNLPPVNGRDLTAEDIKYNLDRIVTKTAAFQRRFMFEEVAKNEVVDKYTVKLTTGRPFVPLLAYLANRYTKVVAKEVAEVKDGLETKYVGTGPFIVENFTRNVGVKLKRNPDYYVQGQPYLDEISIPIVPDAAARLAALRSREIDWAAIAFSDTEALKKTPGDMQFGSIPDTNATNFRMRMNKAPFNDIRVRRALQLGIDRQKIINAVVEGKGYQTGPVAPFLKDWVLPEAEVSKYVRYDPEQAKKLLAEAGYSSGLKFTCNVSTRSGVTWADAAIALKDQVKAIGIEVEIKPMEHSAYVAAQVARDFETMTGSTRVEEPDPDFLYNLLHSKGGRNFSNYNNPKMDELLDKQRGMFNKEERKKAFHDIQRIALEDVPEISLFDADGFVTWQPQLMGYQQSLGEYGLGFRRSFDYWLDK